MTKDFIYWTSFSWSNYKVHVRVLPTFLFPTKTFVWDGLSVQFPNYKWDWLSFHLLAPSVFYTFVSCLHSLLLDCICFSYWFVAVLFISFLVICIVNILIQPLAWLFTFNHSGKIQTYIKSKRIIYNIIHIPVLSFYNNHFFHILFRPSQPWLFGKGNTHFQVVPQMTQLFWSCLLPTAHLLRVSSWANHLPTPSPAPAHESLVVILDLSHYI